MDKINDLLEKAESLFSKFGPDLVAAFFLLILGLAAAFVTKKASRWAVRKLAHSSSPFFSEFIDRKYFDAFGKGIARVTFWTTIFVFLILTAEIFGTNIIDQWLKMATQYLPSLFGGVVILFLGFVIATFGREFLRRSAKGIGLKGSNIIASLFYAVAFFVTLLMAVNQIGIDIEFLTSVILVVIACALLGCALSFGIGSAPIVTNILSTHYVKKDVEIGQHIEFCGHVGKVVDITATSVIILTKEGKVVFPSKKLNDLEFEIKGESAR
jgi:hypothetical protein